MSVHDFERKLDEKARFKAYSYERRREACKLGQKIFASPCQIEDFIPEAGVTLADRQPTLESDHKSRTPFINYYDTDLALEALNGLNIFTLIVNPEAREVSQAECEYATVYASGSSLELTINRSVEGEVRQEAEEDVVKIFETFARCFGVSTD